MANQHGKYPLDSVAFEAFYHGSWHGVDLVNIKNGKLFIRLKYNGSIVEDTLSADFIRPRSRKATVHDCFYFLKTGVDVCVRSVRPIKRIRNQQPESPLWHDAKIISSKGDHCEDRCTCLFTVAFRKSGANKLKETSVTEMVSIDKISILQKLHYDSRDDGFHNWTFSEDCISYSKNKLTSGPLASEVSWLIVLSILKGVEVNIELHENKILYHILNDVEGIPYMADSLSNCGDDDDAVSPLSVEEIKILCFKECNGNPRPRIGTFTLPNLEENNEQQISPDVEENPITTVDSDSDVEVLYGSVALRRSKRLKTLPDRFTSYTEPNFDRPTGKKGDEDDEDEILYTFFAESSSQTDKESKERMLMRNISNYMEQEKHGNEFLLLESDEQFDNSKMRTHLPSKNTEVKKGFGEIRERKLHSALRQKNLSSKFKWNSPNTSNNDRFGWTTQYRYSNKKKLLSSNEYEDLIKGYIKNIESGSGLPFQPDWEQSSEAKLLEELEEFKWSPDDTQVETDENEDLWKEMDDSLSTLSHLEQKKKFESEHNRTSPTTDEGGMQVCQHDCIYDEQIGMICQICNAVCVEIRHIAPKFLRNDGWTSSVEKVDKDTFQWMQSYNLESDTVANTDFSLELPSEACENVWSLIPDLGPKLHSHQKKAYEFIWRNIAGTLKPEEMCNPPEVTGGCVISHSPGAGKTLLMISFLVSYLKLFPRSRPLILAPKIAVCIWSQEFEKWGVHLPLHVFRPTESFKKKQWNPNFKFMGTGDRRPSVKMMQMMDCLLKLKQWIEKPSVLLMSYSTFFAMTDEGSNNECKKFMADLLLKTPGIMILDEGHNPRSTKSKLRKLLMKVHTESRVLLSGTLFQNNFEEYFNTLSLARPRFVEEVNRKLGKRMFNKLTRCKVEEKIKIRKERTARKHFVEQIGQKIHSTEKDERSRGFNLLNNSTNRFIDVYDGTRCDLLPGLHVYTLKLSSSNVQRDVLQKLQSAITQKRCPLELEILIQVGSMHPWLIKTIARVGEYFSPEELDMLEGHKKNFQSGSKMKFVMDLVQKSNTQGEKVLIFCHNISPINFMVDLFDIVFGWKKGEQVLVLQGDQELSEREMIMNKFNSDTKNKCKVILASTLACAEGISLTAASRVVLLDSEWNHSKTRQAIARAFRPGQQKFVYVYRLLAVGTYEEEKYDSNEWKAWLSKMIFLGKYIEFCTSIEVENEDIEDKILKELVVEDPTKTISMVMKQQD